MAATVTLPSAEEIRIIREFSAPPDLVYRAWTTPELVRRWWTGGRGEVTGIEIDLRPGGTWRYAMVADDGSEVAFSGEYREVIPDQRLVYTEVKQGRPDVQALTTVTFTRTGERTTVSITVRYDRQAGPRRAPRVHGRRAGQRDGPPRAGGAGARPGRPLMRPLIVSMSVSLDGFIAGPGGEIDWSAPDKELMSFHNAQTREIAVQLCGRGLYLDMLPWETEGSGRPDPRAREFAAMWTALPKVVFSRTLDRVQGNARLASGDVAAEVARVTAEPGPGWCRRAAPGSPPRWPRWISSTSTVSSSIR